MKQIRYFIFSILVCGFTHLQAVDYETDIQPIFSNNCNGCHIGGTSGGLNLSVGSSYANLVDVVSGENGGSYGTALRINPGSPTTSVLYNKITDTGMYGGAMPDGTDGLGVTDNASAVLIEQWINEGATLRTSPIQVVNQFQINPIYPNPFNPSATISWEQPTAENVHISIFNLQGQLSDEFPLTKSQPGFNSFSWYPENLPAGIYLIRLTGETFTVTQKAIYLK